MFTAVREGRFPMVSTDITTLTGHPAGSFASFVSSLRDAGFGKPDFRETAASRLG
jgi:hypothetical protein